MLLEEDNDGIAYVDHLPQSAFRVLPCKIGILIFISSPWFFPDPKLRPQKCNLRKKASLNQIIHSNQHFVFMFFKILPIFLLSNI